MLAPFGRTMCTCVRNTHTHTHARTHTHTSAHVTAHRPERRYTSHAATLPRCHEHQRPNSRNTPRGCCGICPPRASAMLPSQPALAKQLHRPCGGTTWCRCAGSGSTSSADTQHVIHAPFKRQVAGLRVDDEDRLIDECLGRGAEVCSPFRCESQNHTTTQRTCHVTHCTLASNVHTRASRITKLRYAHFARPIFPSVTGRVLPDLARGALAAGVILPLRLDSCSSCFRIASRSDSTSENKPLKCSRMSASVASYTRWVSSNGRTVLARTAFNTPSAVQRARKPCSPRHERACGCGARQSGCDCEATRGRQ